MSVSVEELVNIYSAGTLYAYFACLYFMFISDTFDAEEAARIFFSDHSETEVTIKLNELASLQVIIPDKNFS